MRASVVAPRSAEQAFSVMAAALQSRASLIVVDSANGLVRERELSGDQTYAPSPHREFKDELTYIRDLCELTNGTVMFLSKPRDKERTPIRGTGVSEKATQRVSLKVLRSRQDGSRLIEASLKTGEVAEYTIRPGKGIDWAEELLRASQENGIVSVSGAWWILPGAQPIQGKEAAAEYIRALPRLAAYLNTEVRKALHI
jgi:recombination protein RecA